LACAGISEHWNIILRIVFWFVTLSAVLLFGFGGELDMVLIILGVAIGAAAGNFDPLGHNKRGGFDADLWNQLLSSEQITSQ
jgi:uncharacterized membrane protein